MNEGMNKGRELPFLGERKEVNHFRQQTAPAGRRQLPEVGGLIELSCAACHSLPPSFQSGCSFRDRRLMWPVVSWLFLTPEPPHFSSACA